MEILKNFSGRFSFNTTDFVKTLRTGILLAICLGVVEFVEYVNLYDFGSTDKLVAMLLTPVADGIRRWARDNSIPLPEKTKQISSL